VAIHADQETGASRATSKRSLKNDASHWVAQKTVSIYFLAFLAAMSFGIIAGLRIFGPGPDYFEYSQAYNFITPYFLFGASRFEPGYELTAWTFATQLKLPFPVFYIFLATFSLFMKFGLFIRYCRSPIYAIFAYLLIFYPIHEYTQIRAAVAIGLAYWAIHFLIERQIIIFFVVSFIAFTFHSSIVLLPAIVLVVIFTPQRLYLPITLFGAIVVPFYFNQIIEFITLSFSEYNPLVSSYIANSNSSQAVNIFSGSGIIGLVILVLLLALGQLRNSRYHQLFFALVALSYVFQFLFTASPVLAVRTGEMLIVAIVFLVCRTPFSATSSLPKLLLIVSGLWTSYRAIGEGVYSW
jgi:EpsG family